MINKDAVTVLIDKIIYFHARMERFQRLDNITGESEIDRYFHHSAICAERDYQSCKKLLKGLLRGE